MSNVNPLLDPSFFTDAPLSDWESEAKSDAGNTENQVLGISETHFLGQVEQTEDYNSETHDRTTMDVDLESGLGIELLGNNGPGSNNKDNSESNHDGEYSEQEYSEHLSEDGEISPSEYSDDDEIDMADSLRETQPSPPLQSPSSPPSYLPPPTPVLRLASLFPPGAGMPSAAATIAYFDSTIRHATRINARKVRVHDTEVTMAEHRLRQLPGMWRRSSKIPSSLRKCWTPYDTFDEYLENTLVAVNEYGAEDGEEADGEEYAENMDG
ncbi:c4b38cab-4ae2-48ae-8dcf-86ceaf912aff-CDS [Sclerotinia trifoliorum]|uniref:C4b38cab-4ae2-48ae-8dcf-86ceaf912aff-CDS n=1 Tax=Sclerotinia trifoliorum TaxID=28548 RepID=A0A8H2VXF6_9HELO|nr:c4b38cab-4ae2-48ae-8dcf-86ceaf912aff-CDS [Sclerotinia trifoliorum]